MPIEGRRPEEVFNEFEEHIAQLFRETLPVPPSLRLRWISRTDATNATLEFVRRDIALPACLPLRAAGHGELFLAMRQYLQAVDVDSKFVLKTTGYSYRLLDEDHPTAQAAIRWEYTGDRAAPYAYCRHHVQTDARVPVNDVVLDLNRLHTPTGWVTIEEVIRFVIYDLGTKPVRVAWPDVLKRSERRFFEDFTTKRYRPLGFEEVTGDEQPDA